MKLLLDTCVGGRAVKHLRDCGHDVVWSGEWASDPGDAEILRLALEEKRVLVTLDKDFGELAVVWGHHHAGILRLVNIRVVDQGAACDLALLRHGAELQQGAIVTVEPGRTRIRPPREGFEP